MVPRLLIDTADIPGEANILRLMQRGAEFSIMLGNNELMNSRLSGSEEALATMSCERIAAHASPRMLIGGLGMGFTLRAALSHLGQGATVTVAELIPEIVTWARGPMAHVHGASLFDPRVDIVEGDVGGIIREARSFYDAILLDVDNGPDGLTHQDNDRLYSREGLRNAHMALCPDGILAVWSAASDPRFSRRLREAGFEVEEIPVRAHGTRGARHMIWIATR